MHSSKRRHNDALTQGTLLPLELHKLLRGNDALWCTLVYSNSSKYVQQNPMMLWHKVPSCPATSTTPHRPNCLFSFSVGEDRDSQLFETVQRSEAFFQSLFLVCCSFLRRLRNENSDWSFWPHSTLTIGDRRELEAVKLDRTECQEGSWFFQLCYNHCLELKTRSVSLETGEN